MAAQAEAENWKPSIMVNSFYNHQPNAATRARQNDPAIPMIINSLNGQPTEIIDHLIRAFGYPRGGVAIPNDLPVDPEAANRGGRAPVNNDAGAGFNAGGGYGLFGNNADLGFNEGMMRAGLDAAAAYWAAQMGMGMGVGVPVWQMTAGSGFYKSSTAEVMKMAEAINMGRGVPVSQMTAGGGLYEFSIAEAMKMGGVVPVSQMATGGGLYESSITEAIKMDGGVPVSQMTAGGGLYESFIAEAMKMGGVVPVSQMTAGGGLYESSMAGSMKRAEVMKMGGGDPAIVKETCRPENLKVPVVCLQDILANFDDNGTYGAFQDDKFTGYYGGSENDQHDWSEEFGIVGAAAGMDLMEGGW
jgi:hypothetical protein